MPKNHQLRGIEPVADNEIIVGKLTDGLLQLFYAKQVIAESGERLDAEHEALCDHGGPVCLRINAKRDQLKKMFTLLGAMIWPAVSEEYGAENFVGYDLQAIRLGPDGTMVVVKYNNPAEEQPEGSDEGIHSALNAIGDLLGVRFNGGRIQVREIHL